MSFSCLVISHGILVMSPSFQFPLHFPVIFLVCPHHVPCMSLSSVISLHLPLCPLVSSSFVSLSFPLFSFLSHSFPFQFPFCFRRHLHPCRLRQAKSHWRTADPSLFSLPPGAKSHRHLGAGCNSAGTVTHSQGRPGSLQCLPLPWRWSQLSAHSPTVKVVPAIQPASRSFGHFPASGACIVCCRSGNLEARPPAICGKLGTLDVLGGACAVCCKLGPAVCGKLGALETDPVLAGSSAACSVISRPMAFTRRYKRGTLQAEPLPILAPSRLDS